MIGSLADLASLPGVPSEMTLRRMIRENDDFPIVEHGKNGVGYKIDFTAALAWLNDRKAKEADEARARAEQIRQFGFDLGLGNEADQAPGLSIAERKQLLEEELVAIKLAEKRGELVKRAEVEGVLGDVLVRFRQTGATFAARLAKRIDLTRDQITAIERQIRADQAELAAMMEKWRPNGGDGSDNPAAEVEDSAVRDRE